jgi:hypothetical protein
MEDAADAAAEARVTVYAFGLRGGPAEAGSLATGPLERLSAATGGAFAPLGKTPERVIERAVRELSACYVLGVEAVASPARSPRRPVRVETARKGVTVRSPAWLVPFDDTADRVLAAAPRAAPSATGASAVPPADAVSAPQRKRDPDLDLALARLFAYADAYERQYSMLVAEEDYRQSAPKGGLRLRSDLLLVRPTPVEEWVSFRDVFEVDGRPVRDREERLRRLLGTRVRIRGTLDAGSITVDFYSQDDLQRLMSLLGLV